MKGEIPVILTAWVSGNCRKGTRCASSWVKSDLLIKRVARNPAD